MSLCLAILVGYGVLWLLGLSVLGYQVSGSVSGRRNLFLCYSLWQPYLALLLFDHSSLPCSPALRISVPGKFTANCTIRGINCHGNSAGVAQRLLFARRVKLPGRDSSSPSPGRIFMFAAVVSDRAAAPDLNLAILAQAILKQVSFLTQTPVPHLAACDSNQGASRLTMPRARDTRDPALPLQFFFGKILSAKHPFEKH